MKSSGSGVSGSGRVIILSLLVVLTIAVIAGAIIYADKVAPLRAPVLRVNESEVSMGYFLKRAALAHGDPAGVLQTLIVEEIIKQVAPAMPYSIRVTEADVEMAMRAMAAASFGLDQSASIGDNEFKSWHQQELEMTGFTDSEYRDKVRIELLRSRLVSYLADRVPTVAEQVKLSVITVGSADQAQNVIGRLDAGVGFIELSEELKATGLLTVPEVEIGWRPRRALNPTLAAVAFDELEVGEHSKPLVTGDQHHVIIKVEERARAMHVDEQLLEALKVDVLDNWLLQEVPRHTIAVHGINNGYDQETMAWVSWQLQQLRRKN